MRLAILSLLAIFGLNSSAQADLLLTTDTTTDRLLSVDRESGATTAIGSLGYDQVQGLAFDSRGRLFGVDSATDQLLSINPFTGAANSIGSLGLSSTPTALSFNPVSNELVGVEGLRNQLISINTVTGEAVLGATLDRTNIRGLAFQSDGTLFGVTSGVFDDNLVTIDLATGTTQLIGSIAQNTNFNRGVFSLTFTSDGELFGIDSNIDQLLSINPTTGEETEVGSTGSGQFASLAFDSPQAVPEPTTVAQIACATILAYCIRNRRKRFQEPSYR